MDADLTTGTTTVVLLIMLASIVITDIREHRISNVMVIAILFVGLVSQLAVNDTVGIVNWLGGLAVGFGLFMPFYMGRGMGAGDVKLMAAIGGCLGPINGLVAAGAALVAGAPLVLLYIGLRHFNLIADDLQPSTVGLHTHTHLNVNAKRKRSSFAVSYQEGRKQRVPYAAAIAAGAIVGLWWAGNLETLAGALLG